MRGVRFELKKSAQMIIFNEIVPEIYVKVYLQLVTAK